MRLRDGSWSSTGRLQAGMGGPSFFLRKKKGWEAPRHGQQRPLCYHNQAGKPGRTLAATYGNSRAPAGGIRRDGCEIRRQSVPVRDENGHEWTGNSLNHFCFYILLQKAGAETEQSEMEYTCHENGWELKILVECIIV